jgi:bifunctional UDP-N-acetylglucosamine pyrophosphorylase/glucosamine-1-phosphate N-acetyltransferase
MTTPEAQALVLAAGKGTRMKSARAKVLHAALGAPLLEHVLRAVEALGLHPVRVVVGHQAEAVRDAFSGRGLEFLAQDPPLGTGHALLAARGALAGAVPRTLLVLNGDLPLLRAETLARLLEAHRREGAAATLLTAEPAEPADYGRIVRGAAGRVQAIVEARDATPQQLALREVNAGVYAFEVAPLLAVLSLLRPQNAQGEYYLTDTVALLAAGGHAVHAWAAADPSEAMGVNTLAELADADRLLRERRLRELMAEGARIEDPSSTFVGLDAVIEPDALIRPFCIVEGRSRLGAGASLGPFSHLIDTVVEAGARILDHCVLREARVEAGAQVGPFAHVRPESVIGPDARVGNFVELKKTRLGEGAKAPHLSYLGDAEIGPRTNVGAGTITCNYDGVDKHPTLIGAGAFVGSNSTLVAPVSVGEGAYVGAGSTITEDVPPNALALGRARQVVKPDWAKRRRERDRSGKP